MLDSTMARSRSRPIPDLIESRSEWSRINQVAQALPDGRISVSHPTTSLGVLWPEPNDDVPNLM
jgi:hypothetical protein